MAGFSNMQHMKYMQHSSHSAFDKAAIILMEIDPPGVEEIHRLCPSSVCSAGLWSDPQPSKEEDGWKPW